MSFFALSSFWFVGTLKAFLFWIYLWQSKGYQLGRLIDHFKTGAGKKTFLNWLFFFKVVLLIAYFGAPLLLLFFLIFIYLGECLWFIISFFRKRIIKPVFTKKAVFLVFIAILVELLVIAAVFIWTKDDLPEQNFWLLLVDILVPLIVLIIVFLAQFVFRKS